MASFVIPDLWPESLGTRGAGLTPRDILRVQAEKLSQHMGGLLRGEVEELGYGDKIHYRLWVVAPTLPKREVVLEVVRDAARPYPVYVGDMAGPNTGSNIDDVLRQCDEGKSSRECRDRRSFEAELQRIFSSEDTRSVIDTLLAHVREKRGPARTEPEPE